MFSWQWLQTASQGQAVFLGTLTGSSIGLVALLLGALFNAHLNRRRDDRLRREERRTVAAALKAELAGWSHALNDQIKILEEVSWGEGDRWPAPVLIPRLLSDMVPKLGLLGPETIGSVIAAYNVVEQNYLYLMKEGAELSSSSYFPTAQRQITLPPKLRPIVLEMNKIAVSSINHAIVELDRY